MTNLGWMLAASSLCLYIVALMLPAIRVKPVRYSIGQATSEPQFRTLSGWQCLTQEAVVVPAWLANPALLAGGIALAVDQLAVATVLGWIAVGSAVVAGALAVGFGRGIAGLRPGYYVWLTSTVAFLLAATS